VIGNDDEEDPGRNEGEASKEEEGCQLSRNVSRFDIGTGERGVF
jgi:hypothetical protein